MPVTNLSVGSFFALSEPDRVTSSAFAYQLTSQIKEMNLQEKSKTLYFIPGRTQKISKRGRGSKKNSIPHSGADPENFGGEGIKF